MCGLLGDFFELSLRVAATLPESWPTISIATNVPWHANKRRVQLGRAEEMVRKARVWQQRI
jgi:hypothetical protein